MATAAFGGMVLLESGNRILSEVVRDRVSRFQEDKKSEEKRPSDPMDARFCDFDDVMFRVVVDKEKPNILSVSANMPFYQEIKEFATEYLKTVYGDYVVEAASGQDVTLDIDMDAYTGSAVELAEKIALLKTHTVGAVFNHYFSALINNSAPPQPFKFSLRRDTVIYLIPNSDRVSVIFALDFNEKSDRAIARVFLQEFVESRRHLGAAPPCMFNHNPPLELKVFNVTEPISDDHLGFINFSILKSHIDGAKKERAVAMIQSFRNYLQYHIKCSKAYFHSRMRARVVSLLKILNRAKQETEEVQKVKMSGKTFVRKDR